MARQAEALGYIGARRNEDGTLDLSRAAVRVSPAETVPEDAARAREYIGARWNADGTLDLSRAVYRERETEPAIQEEEPFDLERRVNAEHTAALRSNVLERGMSVARGSHLNVPNEDTFREAFGLDGEDIAAISTYKGAGASMFNRFQREGGGYPYLKKEFETLLDLFGPEGKLPVTQGGELLYRGLPIPGEVGKEIVDPAFMSMSTSEGVGMNFARSAKARNGSGYLARAVLPEGVRYLPVGGGEEECVLQPGLRLVPKKVIPRGDAEYDKILEGLPERYRTVDIDGVIDVAVETGNAES